MHSASGLRPAPSLSGRGGNWASRRPGWRMRRNDAAEDAIPARLGDEVPAHLATLQPRRPGEQRRAFYVIIIYTVCQRSRWRYPAGAVARAASSPEASFLAVRNPKAPHAPRTAGWRREEAGVRRVSARREGQEGHALHRCRMLRVSGQALMTHNKRSTDTDERTQQVARAAGGRHRGAGN